MIADRSERSTFSARQAAPDVASAVLAGGAVIAGLGVLIVGWGLGVEAFVRVQPSDPAIVRSTAICSVALGAGLFLNRYSQRRWATLAQQMVALAVAALAAVDLIVLLAGNPLGVDGLIFAPEAGRYSDAMAFATAFDFLLGAWCLHRLAGRKAGSDPLFAIVATTGLLTAATAIVGFAFDAEALYGVFIFSAMSLYTALIFVLIFGGFLMARADHGWVGIVLGEGSGSAGARRLLPVMMAASLLLCLAALSATRAGWFSPNFRLSGLAIAMMAITSVAVLRNARLENKSEARLLQIQAELEATAGDKDLLLREVYHRVKNNLQQINAMIAMERRKLEDSEARDALQNLSGRVHTLGMIHQRLMEAKRPSMIAIGGFLEALCSDIGAVNNLDALGVALSVEADDEPIDLDVAAPIGLLANELVTSAIRAIFPAGQQNKGALYVRFRRESTATCRLEIGANRPGLKAALADGTGVSARLVSSLVQQLEAQEHVEETDGSTWSIAFPCPAAAPHA